MAKTKRTASRPTVSAEPPPADDKPKRRGTLVQLYLDDETLAALEALRSSQRFKPERTQIALRGLVELLEREGYWPPKEKPK